MPQRNSISDLPEYVCRECAERVPLGGDDICNRCALKGDKVAEVRYIISILEMGVLAAQRMDRSSLICSLRDARHAIQDMEKVVR